MSVQESFICPVCQKALSTKYTLQSHLHRVHLHRDEARGFDDEIFTCCSICKYNTIHRIDLKQHQARCAFYQAHQHFDERLITQQKEYEQQLLEQKSQMDHLQIANNFLRTELEKAQAVIERTAQRPTTTTNLHHSVKITNYLADHETYRSQTDPDRVAKMLFERLPEYIADGQSGLARCLEENVIRKGDEMILCCTDPTRNRFRYLNEKGELVDDMRAHHFTKTVSVPVKAASLKMFQEHLTAVEQKKVGVTDPFELHRIDQEIDAYRVHLIHIKEFDDHDSNHQIVGALSDRLRQPVT